MAQDFYSILAVPRDATQKQIRDAYRRLARKYHPDVNPDDGEAAERFKKINEAYHVLADEKTRKDYDEFGEHWRHADEIRKAGSAAGGRRGGFEWVDFGGNGDSGAGFGFDDLGDILGRFGFGGGGGSRGTASPFSRQGGPQRPSQEVPVEISLEEAYHGSKRLITYNRHEPCLSCRGVGGRGMQPCAACGGMGATPKPVRLEVTIPPGIEDEGRIRLRPDSDTEIVLRVSLQKHPKFRRAGADLHTEVKVPYLDAVLGGEVEVPTLTGVVALKLPEGTQNGKVFRLAGKGMPRRNGSGQGSLYATVSVVLPTSLSDEERDLYQRLRRVRRSDRVGATP